jgi:hypothetical protein
MNVVSSLRVIPSLVIHVIVLPFGRTVPVTPRLTSFHEQDGRQKE